MYTDVKLEKGLYSITGKTFTQALAELDPDSAYEKTELKGLDAFERQLKRFDIKVRGERSDKVDKFFRNIQSTILFPEYIRRSIKAGFNEKSILGEVAATTNYTESMNFTGLTMTDEGAINIHFPEEDTITHIISLSDKSKFLTQFKRKLSCCYQCIKELRLETFGIILKNLGESLARDTNDACVSQIISDKKSSYIIGGGITYNGLTQFWSSMKKFDMNRMICSPEAIAKILSFEEMKYCMSDYISSDTIKTPYGITLVKCSELRDNIIIGIDNNHAVETVLGSDIVVDYDNLLSMQFDEISCSIKAGFSVLADDAIKVLRYA